MTEIPTARPPDNPQPPLTSTPPPPYQPTHRPTQTPALQSTPEPPTTTTPETTATPAPTRQPPAPGTLAPLPLESPQQLATQLSQDELACINQTVSLEELHRTLINPHAITHEEQTTLAQCLEDDTVTRVFLTGLIADTPPLSAKTSRCIRTGLEDLDLRSIMFSHTVQDDGTASASAVASFTTVITCMNDQEWNRVAPRMGMEPEERETLICITEAMGGLQGMAQAFNEEEKATMVRFLGAAIACEPTLTEENIHIQQPTPTPGENGPLPEDPALASIQMLYNLPWMKDGISSQEQETARRLDALRRYNPELALRVTAMPFLKTHQPTDSGAVSALASISWQDPAAANLVADHPSLKEGITDDLTVAVALTHGEFTFGSDPTGVLGDNAPPFHSHTATLPLAGDILITIAATDGPERAAETAKHVAQDLAWLEEYLDQPLRTANVLIHYGSNLPPAAKGANVQSSIMHLAHQQNQANYHWLQHELTHYWFNSNQTWLDEGMAQVMTSLLNSSGKPASLPATSPSCPESTRISDLGPELPKNQAASRCIYAVGERFFKTLYQEIGYEAFKKGARSLVDLANQPPFQVGLFK